MLHVIEMGDHELRGARRVTLRNRRDDVGVLFAEAVRNRGFIVQRDDEAGEGGEPRMLERLAPKVNRFVTLHQNGSPRIAMEQEEYRWIRSSIW